MKKLTYTIMVCMITSLISGIGGLSPVAAKQVTGLGVIRKSPGTNATMIKLNTGEALSRKLLAQTTVSLRQNNVSEQTDTTGNKNDAIPNDASRSSLASYNPNPISPSTTIDFNIVKNDTGYLTIYNGKGQAVVHKRFNSGEHSYEWNTGGLSSGVYLYRLRTYTADMSKKVNLLK